MTTIYDSERDAPPRMLNIDTEFALQRQDDLGRLLVEGRYRAARAISDQIIEKREFFDMKADSVSASLRCSVIVLTPDEYRELCHRKFREGIAHANGFMPAG